MQQLLFMFGIIAFFSCNTNHSSNEQEYAKTFYDEISEITSSVEVKSTDFLNCFKVVGPLAKRHPNYQIDRPKIDSFKSYYDSMIYSFDNALGRLKKLKEFDTSFKIIYLLSSNYQIFRKAYDSTIPIYIAVYKNGWSLSSPFQKEIIMTGSNILDRAYNESSVKTDSFVIELNQFIKKYKIKY